MLMRHVCGAKTLKASRNEFADASEIAWKNEAGCQLGQYHF